MRRAWGPQLDLVGMSPWPVEWLPAKQHLPRSYSAIGYPPLVRMPSPDPYIATQYLDDGASGVIAEN